MKGFETNGTKKITNTHGSTPEITLDLRDSMSSFVGLGRNMFGSNVLKNKNLCVIAQ